MSELIKASDMMELAKVADLLVRSKFCGIKDPADVLWIVATGQSLGMDAMASLRGIHIINGKPVLSADVYSGLAMAHPACICLQVIEMTERKAVVKVQRKGWSEPSLITYTIEDAQRAQLASKTVWKAFPADMLKARAIARAARVAFPDAFLGVYIEGELEETREEAPAVTHPDALDVTPAPQPPPARRAPSREDEGEEHDALCAQLRTWLKEAALGKERNAEIVEGFLGRYGEGAGEMGRVPLKALRSGIEDLAVRIERHGLATALRDLCEWAPNPVEAPIERPTPHTAA